MTPPHKLLIIQTKQGIIRIQKFRMKDNLDTILRLIEELALTDMIENGILGIVSHIVSDNGWECVAFKCKDAAFE